MQTFKWAYTLYPVNQFIYKEKKVIVYRKFKNHLSFCLIVEIFIHWKIRVLLLDNTTPFGDWIVCVNMNKNKCNIASTFPRTPIERPNSGLSVAFAIHNMLNNEKKMFFEVLCYNSACKIFRPICDFFSVFTSNQKRFMTTQVELHDTNQLWSDWPLSRIGGQGRSSDRVWKQVYVQESLIRGSYQGLIQTPHGLNIVLTMIWKA